MNGIDREKRLARLRENSRRYYEAHREEIAERRKEARKVKLQGMTGEEFEAYRKKNAEYQKQYRAAHPEKVAEWNARTWAHQLEKYKSQEADNT